MINKVLVFLIFVSLSFAGSNVYTYICIDRIPLKFKDSIMVKLSFKDANTSNRIVFDTLVSYASHNGSQFIPYNTYDIVKNWTFPVIVKALVLVGDGTTKWFEKTGTADSAIVSSTAVSDFACFNFSEICLRISGICKGTNGGTLNDTERVKIKYTISDSLRIKTDSMNFGIFDVMRPDMADTCIAKVLYKRVWYKFLEIKPVGNNNYRCDVYCYTGNICNTFVFPIKDTIIKDVNFIYPEPTSITQTPINHPILLTHIQSITYDLKGKKIVPTHSTADNLFITKHSKVVSIRGKHEL